MVEKRETGTEKQCYQLQKEYLILVFSMGSNPNLHFLFRCPAPLKQFSLFGTLVREFPIDASHLCLLWVKAEEIRGGTQGRLHRPATCSSLRPQQNTPGELSVETA